MREWKALPLEAWVDMASFLNAVESLGWWREDLQNLLYLMLPWPRRGPPRRASGDPSPSYLWFIGFGRPRS
eukprot:3143823-Amphidinium_carterae.1